MKKFLLAGTVLALFGATVTMSVMAQPPRGDGPDGPPPGGPGERGPGREGRPPMPNPLFAALDKNGDGEISADELKEATTSLLTLDKNGDGKLTDEETRPPRPVGDRRDESRGDRPPRGFEGPGRGEGPPRGFEGPSRGEGPPRGFEGPGRGEGPPRGFEGPGRGEGPPRGFEGPGRGEGPPRGFEGPGRGEGPPGRGPMGPPNPERFVDEAMRFDADGDGKLDKAELTKFAEEMVNRQGPPPNERDFGRGPRRPERDRPTEGDEPRGDRDGGSRERPDAE